VRLGQLSLDGSAVIGFRHAGGQNQIDPKGTVSDLLANPSQFVLDLLGRVAGRTQNPEPSSMTDGRDNRWVMGEAKNGLSNTQALAQARLQSIGGRHEASSVV
jgi:hypothetical protein